ncbi:MAG TPA: hypothetical protein VFY45_03375 [Baekduia sp.]|nr:hypothetical protein [Baekduia sp.]
MIATEPRPAAPQRTLATDLEAHRLEHRTRRMTFVIDALEFSRQPRSERRRLGKLRDTNPEESS